jgi:hypothetical protein
MVNDFTTMLYQTKSLLDPMQGAVWIDNVLPCNTEMKTAPTHMITKEIIQRAENVSGMLKLQIL